APVHRGPRPRPPHDPLDGADLPGPPRAPGPSIPRRLRHGPPRVPTACGRAPRLRDARSGDGALRAGRAARPARRLVRAPAGRLLGVVSPFEAFTLAGSSMLTLGFAVPPDDAGVALSFTAAGLGLVLLALFITSLPSLYGAFQRRERGVAKLEVRAGQPPSGVYLIELAWTVGRLE